MRAAAHSISNPGLLLGGLIGLVAAALVAEIIYTFVKLQRKPPLSVDNAVRALLALVLVGAVVLLAGAALGGTGMEQASNLLLGGVVASAASAVAFYFASRTVQNAQQNVLDAQKNIIDASGGTVIVPHLKGLTVKAAEANLKALGLRLKYEGSDLDVQVRDQQPDAEVSVPRQTEITVVV